MAHTLTTTKGVIIPLRVLHKALWTWLERTGSDNKGSWPGWEWNGGNVPHVSSNCFACQADDLERALVDGRVCANCPVFSMPTRCSRANSLFRRWNRCEKQGWRKRYARRVLALGWI